MTIHAMIDIETLGNSAGAAIASIGACAFEPWTDKAPSQTAYYLIDLDSVFDLGFKANASTLEWWFDQSPRAQQEIFKRKPRGHVSTVLIDFATWIRTNQVTGVWSKGTHFDIALLNSYYNRLSLLAPWDFRKVRDSRTLIDVCTDLGLTLQRPLGDVWVPHNALDDALLQASDVQQALAFLKQHFAN